MACEHDDEAWKETGARRTHAGDEIVTYLRCAVCGQCGFRRPPSRVVYTWEQGHGVVRQAPR